LAFHKKATVLWIKQMRKQRQVLNSEVIKTKAKYFAEKFGYGEDDFKATDPFIAGLKRRNNILFTNQFGESGSVETNVIEKWKTELNTYLTNYKPGNTYNLDETALFYRLLPSKTFAFGNESRFGQKKFKDRITLVLISNADGTDRSCCMIGKSKNPRAFRGIKNLPIEYYSQKNSWINSSIYKNIIIKLNNKMKRLNKNIILFVDNCSTHILDIDLSNIVIKFLPSNTTSVTQVLIKM